MKASLPVINENEVLAVCLSSANSNTTRRNRHARRRRLVIQSLLSVAAIVVFYITCEEYKHPPRMNLLNQDNMRRFATTTSNKSDRPIMHTFYKDDKAGEKALLKVWEEEWQRAGFETKILTMEDAEKHPYFPTMKKAAKTNLYNQLCFFRWLAMASQEDGGWMSDYDTFPTNFPLEQAQPLPNNGQFTSFGSQVPALMSGSAEEWTRVSKLLVGAISRTPQKRKSDMHALVVLKKEQTYDKKPYNIDFKGVREFLLTDFLYKSPRLVDCEAMSKGIAVHLSHRATFTALENRFFPVKLAHGDAAHNRSQAASTFLQDWRTQCQESEAKDE